MSVSDDRADEGRLVASRESEISDCGSDDSTHCVEQILPGNPDIANFTIFGDNIEQLKKSVQAFKDAERFLKRSELMNDAKNKLYIPSINELRYYGYHLNKALSANCEKTQFEELKRAERHCHRAAYDAVELGMIINMRDIAQFQADYKDLVIVEAIPKYPEMMAEVVDYQDFIAEHSAEDRTEYYQECSEKLRELQKIRSALENSRSSLNAKRQQIADAVRRAEMAEQRADRLEREAKSTRFTNAVVILIAALLGGVASKYLPAPQPTTESEASPATASGKPAPSKDD